MVTRIPAVLPGALKFGETLMAGRILVSTVWPRRSVPNPSAQTRANVHAHKCFRVISRILRFTAASHRFDKTGPELYSTIGISSRIKCGAGKRDGLQKAIIAAC